MRDGNIKSSKQSNIRLTSGGDGYSAETNTLFINQGKATGIIRGMVDETLADNEANGFNCWKRGKNRPYDPKLAIKCPHCSEWDYVPF